MCFRFFDKVKLKVHLVKYGQECCQKRKLLTSTKLDLTCSDLARVNLTERTRNLLKTGIKPYIEFALMHK